MSFLKRLIHQNSGGNRYEKGRKITLNLRLQKLRFGIIQNVRFLCSRIWYFWVALGATRNLPEFTTPNVSKNIRIVLKKVGLCMYAAHLWDGIELPSRDGCMHYMWFLPTVIVMLSMFIGRAVQHPGVSSTFRRSTSDVFSGSRVVKSVEISMFFPGFWISKGGWKAINLEPQKSCILARWEHCQS